MIKKMFIASLSLPVALTAAVTVTPSFASANEVENVDFMDVPKSHQMYQEIMTMRDEGIIHGYPDNTFQPSQAITRAQVATLFVRSLDLKPIRASKEFKDVPKSSVHYENVQTVYKAGIFDGKPDGTFGISDQLTRAQMSKVLINAFDLKMEKGYIFDDIAEEHWYKDYVATLYVNGITTGNNGKYMPNQSVTRAQYSAFLYRSLHPDKAIKPSKPLQSKPPVIANPQPKPSVVKPNPSQPAGTPPGAIFVKDDPYATYYKYDKKLSDGASIYEFIYQKIDNSFGIKFKEKNGRERFAVYYIDRNVLSFQMVTVIPVTKKEVQEMYEIMDFLAEYMGKK